MTLVAGAVPRLVAVRVKITISPGSTKDGSPDLVIAGSTTSTFGVAVIGGTAPVEVGVCVNTVPVLVTVLVTVSVGVLVVNVPVLVGVSVLVAAVTLDVLVSVAVTVSVGV